MERDVGLDEFTKELPSYRERVRGSGHDARRQSFFDLARRVFGIDMASWEESAWEVEAKVYRGWVDALLSRLVFEFKTDLSRELADAQKQLQRYITHLHQQDPLAQFSAVATDGLTFRIYRPEYANGNAELHALPGFSLDTVDVSQPQAVADCYYRLDALLASFQRTPASPTVQGIVASLGAGSTAFRAAIGDLHQLYADAKDAPAVAVRVNQWNRYLGIVLGQAPSDADLFLRHTFLATLDKLIAYLTLDPDRPPVTGGDLQGVLDGSRFADMGIHNFIEEDFFTWFLAPSTQSQGLAFLRRLVGTLRRYDFRQVSQDILKELYQEIVERDARHDIGEYYTPDWLAELVLREQVKLPERPQASVLDPACGSGTFLFIAIRLVREALEARGWSRNAILQHVLGHVQGVDVHPVAVTTARANYLLALGDLLSGSRPSITVPVYLADSLLPPERQSAVVPTRRGRGQAQAAGRLEAEPVLPWRPGEDNVTFEYPASVMEHPQLLDSLVNAMRQQLLFLPQDTGAQGIQEALDRYRAAVRGEATQAGVHLSGEAEDHMVEMFRQVAGLYRQGKDTVWLFLLKNVPRPALLSLRRFDVVVGNPPWLSLRYFKGAGYAQRVKRLALEDYGLRPYAQTHLATQMELATLFFARAVDLYLKEGGTIAFVMPRSVMVASQHARFNEFSFMGRSLQVKLRHVLDLEDVSPLFNVPSCVLAATKGESTAWPVPCQRFAGRLDGRNLPLKEAAPRLTRTGQRLQRVEGKLLPEALARTLRLSLGRSPYADQFNNGATIYPRVFWFVRRVEQPLGFAAEAPLVETDEEAVRQAKAPWHAIRLRGPVEARFIYATLPSGGLVPFGYTRLSPVVLPVLPEGTRYRVLDVNDALHLGFPHLAGWLREAQRHWEAHAARDTEGNLKESRLVRWLDYRRKLTTQRPDVRYKVLYNKSGTNLVACVVDIRSLPELSGVGGGLDLTGFAADHECYVYEAKEEAEAHYLAAVLNSPAVDTLLKPLQTRGLWGERDIHKRVWQVRIPRFDASDPTHQRLAELGETCHARVAQVATQIGQRYRSPARRRAAVRAVLKAELAEIDSLVRRTLAQEA